MSDNEATQPDDSDNDEVTSPTTPLLGGGAIASMLQSEGPVITCVVLRAPVKQTVTEDGKVAAVAEADKSANEIETERKSSGEESEVEIVIDEIKVDTTPQKNEVEKVLGGPFTFVGQYEDEGIVLIARRGLVEEKEADSDNNDGSTPDEGTDFLSMSVRDLRAQCEAWNVNAENVIEKQELIDALKKKELELPLVNPHQLKPPLHNVRVRGDILVLRVAEVDEPLDAEEASGTDEDDANENDSAFAVNEGSTEEQKVDNDSEDYTAAKHENDKSALPQTEIHLKVPSNTDFFLPYTKAEYLRFLVAPVGQNGHSDDDEEEAREGDNDDDEFQMAAAALEEMTEEEEKSAMLNIVMAELLRKFREENERGANSREVLEIRGTFASLTLSVSCSMHRIHIFRPCFFILS